MQFSSVRRLCAQTAASVFFAFCLTARASTSINFDDGTGAGVAIGNFYAAQGLTFSNAMWSNVFSGRPGTSPPLQLDAIDVPAHEKSTDPIVGVFSGTADMVSISGIDVGFNGVRIDAYDAVVGGNLIASDTYIGTSPGGNTLTPADTHVLQVNVAGIRRFELYEPLSANDFDGVTFDNLTFDLEPVPEPATWVAGVLGIGGIFIGARRVRAQSVRVCRGNSSGSRITAT